jgi:hypothetical protein
MQRRQCHHNAHFPRDGAFGLDVIEADMFHDRDRVSWSWC